LYVSFPFFLSSFPSIWQIQFIKWYNIYATSSSRPELKRKAKAAGKKEENPQNKVLENKILISIR
jgi:hypothetical protein